MLATANKGTKLGEVSTRQSGLGILEEQGQPEREREREREKEDLTNQTHTKIETHKFHFPHFLFPAITAEQQRVRSTTPGDLYNGAAVSVRGNSTRAMTQRGPR